MTKAIEELTVGINFDTDEKGVKAVNSAMDSIGSKALQVGAMVAGAFGANALTFGFAKTNDELGKFGERWGVAASDVSAYDRALQHAGGSVGEFNGVISNLTKMQSLNAAQQAQMLSSLAPAGISDQVKAVMDAENALDGFLVAADKMQGMSQQQQESFFAAMGFTDAQVRLLRTGRQGILDAVAAEKEMKDVTPEMTEASARFNDQWQDLMTNMSGFADNVALPIVSALGDLFAGMNDFIESNREAIDVVTEFAGSVLGSQEAFMIISGLLALKMGSGLLGLGRLLKMIKGLGKGGGLAALKDLVSGGADAGTGKKVAKKGGMLSKLGRAGGGLLKRLPLIGAVTTGLELGSMANEKLMSNSKTFRGMQRGLGDVIGGGVDSAMSFFGGGSQQPIQVNVSLDGQPVSAIVEKRMSEQNEQLIQANETSTEA